MKIPLKSNLPAKKVGKWHELSQIVMKSVKGVAAFTVAEDREADSTRVECVLRDSDAFAEYEQFMIDGRRDGAEVIQVRPIDGFVGRESSSKL
jgi:hypothetical protein